MDKILQANAHVIATMRTKQDYVLNQKDGKYIPEKVGLKAVQRDGVDYEFTLVFDVDSKHYCVASKDRTNLFSGKPDFIINSGTGKKILEWCNNGTSLEDVREQIKQCKELDKLRDLYQSHYTMIDLVEDFRLQKETILSKKQLLNPQNISSNGVTNHS